MLRHRVERAWHCWRATARAQQGRDAQPSTAALSHGTRRCTPSRGKRAIDDITALVGGERRDLNHLTIDVGAAPEFHRRVYEVARRIPAGATLSYGEVAERLGNRTVALSSDTSSRGQGGVATKLRLLTQGAQPEGPMLFDRLPLAAPRTRR